MQIRNIVQTSHNVIRRIHCVLVHVCDIIVLPKYITSVYLESDLISVSQIKGIHQALVKTDDIIHKSLMIF